MPAAGLLALVVAPPLLLAALLAWPPARAVVGRLAPLAALPALIAALLAAEPLDPAVPFLLLGVEVGFGAAGRPLLLAAALIWTAAAWWFSSHGWGRPRLLLSFLVTQAGSLGALLSAEAVGFYLFYSVMTVASYGLVVVDDSAEARRAGRLYLGLSLLGEMAAIGAFMLLAAGTTGPVPALMLVFGLGAKLGVLPLHVALPPAYAAAPPAAGAALGGVLTTVAAAGWLRLLPESGAGLDVAAAMIALGLATALVTALLGMLQSEARALLGYSTASQMGILAVAAGIAVAAPQAAGAAALFVFHHGLVKGALFLVLAGGGGSRAGLALLAVLSLALAGLPGLGGALAKTWIETGAERLPHAWAGIVHHWLPVTSLATTVLMLRFLVLARHAHGTSGRPGAPGWLLAAAALAAPWLAVLVGHPGTAAEAFESKALVKQAWPIAAGLLLALVVARLPRRWPSLPAGDVAVPLQRLLARIRLPRPPTFPKPAPRLPLADAPFRRLAVSGTLFGLAALLFALLL